MTYSIKCTHKSSHKLMMPEGWITDWQAQVMEWPTEEAARTWLANASRCDDVMTYEVLPYDGTPRWGGKMGHLSLVTNWPKDGHSDPCPELDEYRRWTAERKAAWDARS